MWSVQSRELLARKESQPEDVVSMDVSDRTGSESAPSAMDVEREDDEHWKNVLAEFERLRTSLQCLPRDSQGGLSSDVEAALREAVDIHDLAVRCSLLFEWYDGPLVVAMRAGDIILLDEISLAADAVLERLNSVLVRSALTCL